MGRDIAVVVGDYSCKTHVGTVGSHVQCGAALREPIVLHRKGVEVLRLKANSWRSRRKVAASPYMPSCSDWYDAQSGAMIMCRSERGLDGSM